MSGTDLASFTVAVSLAGYHDGDGENETGIYGFEFDSEKNAAQVASAIVTQLSTPDNETVYLLNKTVIMAVARFEQRLLFTAQEIS